MNMKKINWLNVTVYILLIISIYGVIGFSGEPIISYLKNTPLASILYSLSYPNSILFNLSIGLFTSIFFWYLIVAIPEKQKKARIRKGLAMQYKEFKEGVIMNLLFASQGSCAMDLQDKLMDYKEFRSFFSENKNANWYAALNNLEGSTNYLSDILIEMELLSVEVSYVLNNLDSVDNKAYSVFKRLNENIYRLKNSTIYSHDQVKYVGNFIWQLFARWSFADGNIEKDIIQEIIDGL
jgi:hypothetical protein